MKQADIDDGRRAGLNGDERAELVQLRRELRTAKMEIDLEACHSFLRLYVTIPGRLVGWLITSLPSSGCGLSLIRHPPGTQDRSA